MPNDPPIGVGKFECGGLGTYSSFGAGTFSRQPHLRALLLEPRAWLAGNDTRLFGPALLTVKLCYALILPPQVHDHSRFEIDPAARVILSSPDITDATQLLQEMAKD